MTEIIRVEKGTKINGKSTRKNPARVSVQLRSRNVKARRISELLENHKIRKYTQRNIFYTVCGKITSNKAACFYFILLVFTAMGCGRKAEN